MGEMKNLVDTLQNVENAFEELSKFGTQYLVGIPVRLHDFTKYKALIKTGVYDYPHPDWRAWYFGVLMIFYLLLTYVSQIFLDRLSNKFSTGQATLAGKTI